MGSILGDMCGSSGVRFNYLNKHQIPLLEVNSVNSQGLGREGMSWWLTPEKTLWVAGSCSSPTASQKGTQ